MNSSNEKNRFIEKFQDKTDSELLEIIENKTNYNTGAVEASEQILSNRNNNLIKKKSDREVIQESISNIEKEEIKFIPEKNEYYFKRSFLYILRIYATVLFLFLVGFLGSLNGNYQSLIAFIIGIIVIVLNINLLKNKPVVIISKQGLWTKKTELKKWNEIETITVENKSFFKYFNRYINDNMFIYYNQDIKIKPSQTININGLKNKTLLRKLTQHFLNSKEKHSFENETVSYSDIIGNPIIFDSNELVEKWKKSIPKLIIGIIIFSFAYPHIESFITRDDTTLIEKYGYTKSVIFSGLVGLVIFSSAYLKIIYNHRKREKR